MEEQQGEEDEGERVVLAAPLPIARTALGTSVASVLEPPTGATQGRDYNLGESPAQSGDDEDEESDDAGCAPLRPLRRPVPERGAVRDREIALPHGVEWVGHPRDNDGNFVREELVFKEVVRIMVDSDPGDRWMRAAEEAKWYMFLGTG